MNKKVLIFSLEFPPVVGGAGTYSFELSKGLATLGHHVTVLTRDYDSSEVTQIDSELEKQGVNIIRKPWVDKVWFYSWSKLLKQHLESNQYDTVIFANWCSHIVASKIPPELLGEYVPVFHGDEIHYYFGKRTLRFALLCNRKKMRKFLENAKNMIAVSDDMRRQVGEYGFNLTKVKTVLHGIDPSIFYPLTISKEENPLWNQLGLCNNKVMFCAARMERGKGHDMLIKACSKLDEAGYVFKLLLAGDGSLRSEIEQSVVDEGLQEKVIFLGALPRNELINYHHISDFFVMLSRREGETFGIVYIEANACRKPAIAGNIGGVPEAVEEGVSGLLVDPTNLDDCYDKITLAFDNDKLIEDLSDLAYQRFVNHFTNIIMATNTLAAANC
jgi:glycosyltransferase involved in cell wall biosynthesis